MTVDTEAPVLENKKHDIDSLKLNLTKASTDVEMSERPQLDGNAAPRMVRSAEHLNIAQKTQVEGKTKEAMVRIRHVVKIFHTDNDDDFIEGTYASVIISRLLFFA